MTGVTNGVVDAAFGPGVLEFADGPTGVTSMVDTFTTSNAAGLPAIAGTHAPILSADGHINPVGYLLRPLHGQPEASSFTLAMDVYFDAAQNANDWTGLWQSHDNSFDAELHLEHSSNGFWHDLNNSGVGAGSVAPASWSFDTWFRIVYTVDGVQGTAKIFVDGTLVATDIPIDTLPDGTGAEVSWFLSDQNSNSHPLFVAALAVSDVAMTDAQVMALGGPSPEGIFRGELGTNYCTAVVNSTGVAATMGASGSTNIAANNLALNASDMPNNQFGIFVTSMTQGFVAGAGGTSNGNLCVGGSIGRFSLPNQILTTGGNGSFDLTVDLSMVPQGASFTAVSSGDTWNFQAWYRDGVGLGSNFTDGLEITFQ